MATVAIWLDGEARSARTTSEYLVVLDRLEGDLESNHCQVLPELKKNRRMALSPLLKFFANLIFNSLSATQFLSLCEKQGMFPVSAVRRILSAMAVPMKGYAEHQVGSGFVNEPVAKRFLLSLTASKLAELLSGKQSIKGVVDDLVVTTSLYDFLAEGMQVQDYKVM
jgi:hypothetical protein